MRKRKGNQKEIAGEKRSLVLASWGWGWEPALPGLGLAVSLSSPVEPLGLFNPRAKPCGPSAASLRGFRSIFLARRPLLFFSICSCPLALLST